MEPDDPFRDCKSFPPDGGTEFRPEWRTEAVVGLLKGIVEDAAFERMPILADALEEAGCANETILRHFREGTNHDHRCWAIRNLSGLPPVAVTAVPAVAAVTAPRMVSVGSRSEAAGLALWALAILSLAIFIRLVKI